MGGHALAPELLSEWDYKANTPLSPKWPPLFLHHICQPLAHPEDRASPSISPLLCVYYKQPIHTRRGGSLWC